MYVSALEQAEELWEAAEHVGEVAAPIVLYYGLTQALAAWTAGTYPSKNGWRSPASHGLTLLPLRSAQAVPRLSEVFVRDEGNGHFQHIAGALNSPSLSHPASMSALISSLHYADSFIGDDLDPTLLEAIWRPGNDPSVSIAIQSPGQDVIARISRIPLPIWDDPDAQTPPHEPIRSLLTRYPGLSRRADEIHRVDHQSSPTTIVAVWRRGNLSEIVAAAGTYPELIQDSVFSPWPLPPLLAGNVRALHPLATWTAVLYTMSMVARYRPDHWGKMIDLNTSLDAARIRDVLTMAHQRIPWLLANQLWAFDAEPSLPSVSTVNP